MRSARFALLLYLLLVVVPVWGQQPQPPQQTQPVTTTSPVTKDLQAVTILNQALSVAGGIPAIMAVSDYTATGSVTYHRAQLEQGSVTVRGSGLDYLRIDATLPTGVRSEAISNGQFTMKTEDGIVAPLDGQAPMSPSRLILPYLLLAPALNSPGFSLLYKGLVAVDGSSAYDVQLVRVLPGLSDSTGRFREYSTIDFFFDSSTLQLLMVQDVVFRHLLRQVRYSNYRFVNGVLVPFSINVQGAGPLTQLQLSQITFNTGIQASDFQL